MGMLKSFVRNTLGLGAFLLGLCFGLIVGVFAALIDILSNNISILGILLSPINLAIGTLATAFAIATKCAAVVLKNIFPKSDVNKLINHKDSYFRINDGSIVIRQKKHHTNPPYVHHGLLFREVPSKDEDMDNQSSSLRATHTAGNRWQRQM
jgi:hypothetical protein